MYFEIFFLFSITYFSFKILVKVAKKINLLDIPNFRSAHNLPVIKGFGSVIFFSIGVTLFAFNSFLIADHSYLLCAILVIGLMGLVDDMKNTPPIIKILTLVVVYMFLYSKGFLILSLGTFFGIEIGLNLIVAIIFSTLSIVAFTNSFNLIDGLDGLSGLIAIIIFLVFFIIGINNNDELLITIPILFITSLIVFIYYNWHPAKVFLGDSGSLMIGFVISLLAIRSLNYIEPISILYITAVPIIDFLFVIIRRVRDGASIFQADRLHCHHILLSHFNDNVKKTVIVISAFQLAFGAFGLIFITSIKDGSIPLVLFLATFIIIYKLLVTIKPSKKIRGKLV
tara:strand:+ start:214 stop:1233 length:1020 start_codon:yes stop_codon:yes gene_type:complete